MINNKKGFTLMELLAALFIGSMVTGGLILVWKTASVQTSQGQRQTIIRNQISSFQRKLYKDFSEADIIVSPPKNSSNTTSIVALLSGLKKAKRINATQYEPFAMGSNAEGPTKAFIYCLSEGTIYRFEKIINYDIDNPYKQLYTSDDEQTSPVTVDLLTNCPSNATPVLTNFNLTNVSRRNDGLYSLRGNVVRTFADVTNTTPIRVEINETLLEPGGL